MVELIAPTVGKLEWLTNFLAELKKNFLNQKTKYYEWRVGQLKQFMKGIDEMSREF
jgi:hypothetical protein